MSLNDASLHAAPSQHAQGMLFGDPLPELDADTGYRGPVACRAAGMQDMLDTIQVAIGGIEWVDADSQTVGAEFEVVVSSEKMPLLCGGEQRIAIQILEVRG